MEGHTRNVLFSRVFHHYLRCRTQIAEIQQALARDNWTFVPGEQIWEILCQSSCCSKEDFEALHALWDDAEPQCDENGLVVYPFKSTLVSYYQMDASNSADSGASMPRSNEHDWHMGRAIEHIDPTTVGAASHFRTHKQWPAAADTNVLIKGLQQLIHKILSRPGTLDWHAADGSELVFETMMSAFRVAKAADEDLTQVNEKAEPGPEGVHQDSADLTAIVLMDRTNVTIGSAGNRVWSLQQPAGKPCVADLHSSRLIASPVLLQRFDTLMVLDRKVKHEALPIQIPHGQQFGRRDVLTFEARRPMAEKTCAMSKM